MLVFWKNDTKFTYAILYCVQNLAHESGVLQRGLQCLNEKLEALAPLHQPLPSPGGSVLLRELAWSSSPGEATASPQATSLLHTLSAVHAYIMMLVHVCGTGQTEIRQVSINRRLGSPGPGWADTTVHISSVGVYSAPGSLLS